MSAYAIDSKDENAWTKTNYPRLNWSEMTASQMAEELGFVNNENANQACRGYYVEPTFKSVDAALQANQIPIRASADETELSLTGDSILRGNVILEQPNQMVGSNLLYINRDAKSGQIDNVAAYGHVYLRRPGELVVGDQGVFNLEDKTGQMKEPSLSKNNPPSTS